MRSRSLSGSLALIVFTLPPLRGESWLHLALHSEVMPVGFKGPDVMLEIELEWVVSRTSASHPVVYLMLLTLP